jgi:hypothetical protein
MNAPNYLKGIAGYLVDLYRLARGTLTNPHSYFKFVAIDQARKATGSRTFIETGTYLGGTAFRCSKVFDRVYTIELDAGIAARARKNLASRRNVELIEGDAVSELRRLLERGDIGNAVVFLDGHFSGGETAHGSSAEPAVDAVELLGLHRSRIGAVIIDDFRNFGVEPGHPPKSQLIAAVEKHLPHPEFALAIQNDQVIVRRT